MRTITIICVWNKWKRWNWGYRTFDWIFINLSLSFVITRITQSHVIYIVEKQKKTSFSGNILFWIRDVMFFFPLNNNDLCWPLTYHNLSLRSVMKKKKLYMHKLMELDWHIIFEIGRKISVGLTARGVGGNGNLDFIHEEYNNYLHTNKWKGRKLGI